MDGCQGTLGHNYQHLTHLQEREWIRKDQCKATLEELRLISLAKFACLNFSVSSLAVIVLFVLNLQLIYSYLWCPSPHETFPHREQLLSFPSQHNGCAAGCDDTVRFSIGLEFCLKCCMYLTRRTLCPQQLMSSSPCNLRDWYLIPWCRSEPCMPRWSQQGGQPQGWGCWGRWPCTALDSAGSTNILM